MNKKEGPGEILSTLRNLIDIDLDLLLNQADKRERNKTVRRGSKEAQELSENNRRRVHEQFAAYLAALVSQPIGLRVSVSPFNESSESMLAYLMDVFKLSEPQLEDLLLLDLSSKHSKNGKQPLKSTLAQTNGKRQSWRPKLKLQVHPPVLPNERIQDLTVRMYLFSEQTFDIKTRKTQQGLLKGSKNILDLIKLSRSDAPVPIRPSSELLSEVKFVGNPDDGSYRTATVTSTTPTGNTKTTSQLVEEQNDELRLGLRREQCDLKSAHILALEFWLKESLVPGMQSMKKFINSVSNSCCGSNRDAGQPNYRRDGKQFYGYTHIKLHQIPAYATRSGYSIQSLQDKPISSCEICLEFMNDDSQGRSNNADVIINHVRLYAICMAYQLSLLPATTDDRIIDGFAYTRLQASPNLNNLLFVPAFSIINQHRLQNNLSQREDQSLRRAAVLLLVLQLTHRHDHSVVRDSHRILLMSIAEHEYLNAHRLFDNMTRQEVEVFHRDATVDRSRAGVISLECNAIQNFANDLVSRNRIKAWLAKINSMTLDHVKLDVLTSLRLTKTILAHNENNPMVDLSLKSQSLVIKEQVDKLLTTVVAEELKSRFGAIISANGATTTTTSNQKNRTKRRSLKSKDPIKREPADGSTVMNPWQKLSCDIHIIENDIILHWSDKGLNCLKLQQSTGTNSLMNDDNTKKLIAIIQNKINNYLASKS